MILVDTNIWIDYLRTPSPALRALLEADVVGTHPFVLGELLLGGLARRSDLARRLARLPMATSPTTEEVFALIERTPLHGTGIGLVDAHLLAATLLTPYSLLWTRDRRLNAAAEGLRIAYVAS